MNKSWVKEEIERKFLPRELPDEISSGIESGKYDFQKIEQGYIKSGARFRKAVSGNGELEYTLIMKESISDTDGISRNETTRLIDSSGYKKLFSEKEGEIIKKTRYFVPWDNEILQIDIFEKRLAGRVLIEIEFDSLKKAKSFEKPDWFGREITEEINNRALAMGADLPIE